MANWHLKSIKNNRLIFILMDMQMPVMDGYTAIKMIRETFPQAKSSIPILALTAHVLDSEVEKCKTAGATEYLPKPFQPGELYQKINKF